MSLPARLIIADPGLRSALGHHLGYSLAVAEAAQARGIPPVVLASRQFADTLPGGIACLPSFATLYQSAGQSSLLRQALFGLGGRLPAPLAACVAPPLRALRRAMRGAAPDNFAAELAQALAALGNTGGDLVLLHSVSAANLAGLPAALAAAALGRLVVVLRRTPEDMDRDDAGPAPMGRILAGLAAHFGPRLHLLADTAPLCRAWSALIGRPVAEAPLPVMAPPARGTLAGQPPHLVFAGGARAEKGYGLLPGLVAALGPAARFTIHSGPIGSADDPLVQQAHRRLQALAGPGLALLETPLPPDDYLALLQAADLLLLPYNPAAYGPRSSGILAESRAMGVPAVVPRGCWMEEVVGPEPRLAYPTEAAFIATVRMALAELPALLAAYAEAAPAWRAAHSPQALLRQLLATESATIPA